MSLNAAAIAVMVERGLSAADILAVAEALEVRRDPTAAERQARHRAKCNAVTVTRDVTRDIPSPLTPPLKVSPDPFQITPPISPQPIMSADADPVAVEPELKPEHVVEAWNDLAGRHGLSKAKLTPERQRKLKTRIRQCSVDEFTEAIAAFDRSSFLRGENDRGWKPNLDWMLEPRNFTKLQEGAYDR